MADERDYLQALNKLTACLEFAVPLASVKITGIADERRFWAATLVTRLVMMSLSLVTICPRSKLNPYPIQWDLNTIASIARNIYETYIVLQYLCLEELSEDERTTRRLLMYLHQAKQLKKIGLLEGRPEQSLVKLDSDAEEIRTLLASNAFFESFTQGQKKKYLEGNDFMYLSHDEILSRTNSNSRSAIRSTYMRLSSFVHSLPSVFVTNAFKGIGNGSENQSDKNTATLAIHFATSCFEVALGGYIKLMEGVYDFSQAHSLALEQMVVNAKENQS